MITAQKQYITETFLNRQLLPANMSVLDISKNM